MGTQKSGSPLFGNKELVIEVEVKVEVKVKVEVEGYEV